MRPSIEANFLDVYQEHQEAIFRYCYFRLYNRERAVEIMQEAFMKTWQYLSSGNQVDNVKAFVYRVTNNLIIDEVRKKKTSSLEALEEAGFQPSKDEKTSLEEKIDGRLAKEILDRLDEEHRAVIYLRYIEDLQPREIATILGEPVNVISVRIHRGLKKLKSTIDNYS